MTGKNVLIKIETMDPRGCGNRHHWTWHAGCELCPQAVRDGRVLCAHSARPRLLDTVLFLRRDAYISEKTAGRLYKLIECGALVTADLAVWDATEVPRFADKAKGRDRLVMEATLRKIGVEVSLEHLTTEMIERAAPGFQERVGQYLLTVWAGLKTIMAEILDCGLSKADSEQRLSQMADTAFVELYAIAPLLSGG